MSNHFRDNGGKLPTGLDYFHNLLSPPGPFMRLLKRKRKPIVKVEKHSEWGDGKGAWAWDCRTCAYTGYHTTWENAYYQATRHARNHHGR